MKLPHSVSEVLREHVVLENESIDRMYLNVYVPRLQRIGGVVWYPPRPPAHPKPCGNSIPPKLPSIHGATRPTLPRRKT